MKPASLSLFCFWTRYRGVTALSCLQAWQAPQIAYSVALFWCIRAVRSSQWQCMQVHAYVRLYFSRMLTHACSCESTMSCRMCNIATGWWLWWDWYGTSVTVIFVLLDSTDSRRFGKWKLHDLIADMMHHDMWINTKAVLCGAVGCPHQLLHSLIDDTCQQKWL